MKVLKASIILATTSLLLVVTSACIAEGSISKSPSGVMSRGANKSLLEDEALRQSKKENPFYKHDEKNVIRPEYDTLDGSMFRLNLCYSEPKPTWCK